MREECSPTPKYQRSKLSSPSTAQTPAAKNASTTATRPRYQVNVVAEVRLIARCVNSRLRVRSSAAITSRNSASPKCRPLVTARIAPITSIHDASR